MPLKLRASDKADAEFAEEVLLYENSHTLVIGIDAYINDWPRLSIAVKDAEEKAKLAAERAKFAAEAEARRKAEKRPDIGPLPKSKRRLPPNASD